MKTLQECNWKEFAIGDYFTVTRPTSRKEDDYCEGRIIFVASGAVNNGVTKFCQPRENEILDKGNCLTVSPVDGSCYYQDTDFLGRGGAGSSVIILYPKAFALNKHNALFISRCINQTASSKYSYGLMASKDRIKKDRIILPSTPDNTPDWQFMEDYMREVESKLLAQAQPALQEKVNKYANLQLPTLNSRNWKIFAFTELFDIRDGYYNKKPPFEPNGKIPFLGATQNDNGITGFYTLPTIQKYDKVGNIEDKDNENRVYKGNCIAVTNDGSVGKAYYQRIPFTCSHSITPLYLRNHVLNRNIAQFLIPLIMKSGESFEYGRKWRPKRMRNSQLLLPVTPDNTPDWQFMEDYMRAVEAKQIAAYLRQKY